MEKMPACWTGPIALLMIALGAALIVFCSGCTLQVNADGTRTWSANGEDIARALIILSDK